MLLNIPCVKFIILFLVNKLYLMVNEQLEVEYHLYSVSIFVIFYEKIVHHNNTSICIAAQFGAWSFGPQHGFARITRWIVEKPPDRLPSGDVEAIFSIMDDDFTRSMWNYQ